MGSKEKHSFSLLILNIMFFKEIKRRKCIYTYTHIHIYACIHIYMYTHTELDVYILCIYV